MVPITPKLWLWSLYGPFTSELDSMILVSPIQITILFDSVKCHISNQEAQVNLRRGHLSSLAGRGSLQGKCLLFQEKFGCSGKMGRGLVPGLSSPPAQAEEALGIRHNEWSCAWADVFQLGSQGTPALTGLGKHLFETCQTHSEALPGVCLSLAASGK